MERADVGVDEDALEELARQDGDGGWGEGRDVGAAGREILVAELVFQAELDDRAGVVEADDDALGGDNAERVGGEHCFKAGLGSAGRFRIDFF